jgi:hypothetical protein
VQHGTHCRCRLRGFARVGLEQASQELLAFHLKLAVRRRDGLAKHHRSTALSIRYLVANPLVRAVAVEETPIAGECPLQTAQTEQDQMVKALSRHTAHPSFCIRVGIRRAERRLHRANARPGENPAKVMDKQRITIVHDIPRHDSDRPIANAASASDRRSSSVNCRRPRYLVLRRPILEAKVLVLQRQLPAQQSRHDHDHRQPRPAFILILCTSQTSTISDGTGYHYRGSQSLLGRG